MRQPAFFDPATGALATFESVRRQSTLSPGAVGDASYGRTTWGRRFAGLPTDSSGDDASSSTWSGRWPR